MTEPVLLAELWRGDFLESRHLGHAIVVSHTGDVVDAWGNPDLQLLPRSAVKMLQALPLVESGAAARAGLSSEDLALACGSHTGAAIHTTRVADWLDRLGLGEADLRCGPQTPDDAPARHGLRAEGHAPCQLHNNCSGKHAGFLTLSRDLGAGPEYVDPAHAVQRRIHAATEELTGNSVPGFGIDGCSAPNFVTTLRGLATALARFARPEGLGRTRADAIGQLVEAMRAHPILIEGVGTASTNLTAVTSGRTVVKTGAEGVFAAILPELGLGVALKVEDGATRASEAAIAGTRRWPHS